jgi:hypothetical protein
LLHVDDFFLKTSSKLGVTGSSRVNNVKKGFTDETDDDEDVDDADEVERVVTICGGEYCGIGAASNGVGGSELGGEGGFREYASVTCAEGTPRAYFDGGGGWGMMLLV